MYYLKWSISNKGVLSRILDFPIISDIYRYIPITVFGNTSDKFWYFFNFNLLLFCRYFPIFTDIYRYIPIKICTDATDNISENLGKHRKQSGNIGKNRNFRNSGYVCNKGVYVDNLADKDFNDLGTWSIESVPQPLLIKCWKTTNTWPFPSGNK